MSFCVWNWQEWKFSCLVSQVVFRKANKNLQWFFSAKYQGFFDRNFLVKNQNCGHVKYSLFNEFEHDNNPTIHFLVLFQFRSQGERQGTSVFVFTCFETVAYTKSAYISAWEILHLSCILLLKYCWFYINMCNFWSSKYTVQKSYKTEISLSMTKKCWTSMLIWMLRNGKMPHCSMEMKIINLQSSENQSEKMMQLFGWNFISATQNGTQVLVCLPDNIGACS